MSRLTSAQLISLGEYLEPQFDPATLTVSQLLGILGYHNVEYPTPYTKPKLILLFNNEIKPRASKFKKERLKKEASIASEDGITDGHTGQPLVKKGKAPVSLTRRSSRRLSQIPKEEEFSPVVMEKPKRRRSSAQPVTVAASIKLVPTHETVLEESEPEEEELELPLKKVGRSKKLTSAGVQGRRISQLQSGEESGWEDKNIFQSGAESSSPARPSPSRPRASKTSPGPRKSRKSTSVPPQMIESSPLRSSDFPSRILRSPPQSPFRPSLPPMPLFNKLPAPSSPRSTPAFDFTSFKPEPAKNELDDDGDSVGEEEATSAEENDFDITDETRGDMDSGHPSSEPSASWFLRALARLVVFLALSLVSYWMYSFKIESSSIGYCEAGTNSSRALEELLSKRSSMESCKTLPDTDKVSADCSLPPLIPVPHPSSCTPCPEHASCGQFDVACQSGYILKPHYLLSFIPVLPSPSDLSTRHASEFSKLFFQSIHALVDGLPGFGSVALSPRCIEDPRRKRHIGALGKTIESKLAIERGNRLCNGNYSSVSQSQIPEAQRWGIEENELKDFFKTKAKPELQLQFDELFRIAIEQLTQWSGVFVGEVEGKRYVSHEAPKMSLSCTIIVASRELWATWRKTVLGFFSVIAIGLGMRVRMTRKQKENRRVASLVQVALDTLRNREFAHYADPVSAPQPYLSSIQLRDLVLQEEHSVSTRRHLWEKVEHVVESNVNVRANLEEIEGGDELRVWRWVGSTGRTPGRKEIEQD